MQFTTFNKYLLYVGIAILVFAVIIADSGITIPLSENEGKYLMKNKFKIGDSTLNGSPIYVTPRELLTHWAIYGSTGRGKSRAIDSRVRYHLANKHGAMILDPHGFLYEDILAYASAYGYKDRIITIDPNETGFAVGINFLENRWMDDAALASQIMKAIAKVFGQDEGDTLPRLERWQRSLLISLIQAKLTLADMLDFLSTSDPLYRQSVLKYVNNPYVLNEWMGFDAIKKRSDMENLIEAPLNRAAKLILSDPIRRIIGQDKSTVSIGDAIEQGKIVLVNLAPKRVSRECQQVLGILLVDQVVNYAFQRSKKQAKKPFFVIIDEAAELTSNDLPYALQALRKYGIFFTLCFQTLAQTRKIAGYYENLMSNTDVKIAFKTSRADAEELIGELFAGRFKGDITKDELYRTLLIPKESRREIIGHTVSRSESIGESNSTGESSSESIGSGSSEGFGENTSDQFLIDNGIFGVDNPVSQTVSVSHSSVSNDQTIHSTGSSSSYGTSSTITTGESTSKTIVPFYEYIREQELANRQFYSIEEIREKYIAWVMCQPMRHAQIKIGDKAAVPILTKFVRDVHVRDKDKRRIIDRSNSRYALPVADVDRLIEERRRAVLQGPIRDAETIEEEIEDARWQ